MPIRIKMAAQAVGVSPQTLLRLEKKGLIQPIRSQGNQRWYLPETIEQARAAYWPKVQGRTEKSETVSV